MWRSFAVLILVSLTATSCALWPGTRDAVVDCGKEAARDVWSLEAGYLREMTNAGVSYESVVSYTAGLVVRFGKSFVVCLFQRLKADNAMLAASPATMRAGLYADRWLAENR